MKSKLRSISELSAKTSSAAAHAICSLENVSLNEMHPDIFSFQVVASAAKSLVPKELLSLLVF
jgi:hypothetical protein